MRAANRETQHILHLEGLSVPLTLRHNRRARRMIMRIVPAEGERADGLVITVPPGSSPSEALRWAQDKQHWIVERFAQLSPRIPFSDNGEIPFQGTPHIIRHRGGRGTVDLSGTEINVYGAQQHLTRRLTDWLKKQARQEIEILIREKTSRLGLQAGRLSIRDTRSRWGSCAANGNLSFCWRLILAPPAVLEYVVAHEVAHLKEHNHSPRFWAETEKLCEHTETSRNWLKRHGESLRRYG